MSLHRTLYTRALGAAFETLPPVLQRLHQGGDVTMEGVLRVRWSEHRGVNAMMRVLPLAAPGPSNAMPSGDDANRDRRTLAAGDGKNRHAKRYVG